MGDYLRMCGDVETENQFYRGDAECLGHLEGVLESLEKCFKGEPTKHFLTREPVNSAEEYAQAVGWNLLRAV